MRYLMNFDNFKAEFALPSRVQVDRSKYCSVSRKYRQCPPKLLRGIGDKENIQIDSNFDIYPTQELIELKRQFLNQKKYFDKYEAPKIDEVQNRETFKYVVSEDPKKFQGESILDKKAPKDPKEVKGDAEKVKTQKITESAEDDLQISNSLTKP